MKSSSAVSSSIRQSGRQGGGDDKEEEPDTVHVIGSWDMRMSPVKKRMINGHMVPTVKGLSSFFNKKPRRVVLEVHSPPAAQKGAGAKLLTFLHSSTRPHAQQPNQHERVEELGDHDTIVVRILKKSDEAGDDDSVVFNEGGVPGDDTHGDMHSEVSSAIGKSFELEDDHHNNNNDNWIERNRFLLGNMEVKRTTGKYIEVKAGAGPDSFTRIIQMKTEQHVTDFCLAVQMLQDLERQRGDRQLQAYRSAHAEDTHLMRALGSTVGDDTSGKAVPINLLVEIVSAKNLPAADDYTVNIGLSDKLSKMGSTFRKSMAPGSQAMASLEKSTSSTTPAAEPQGGTSDPYVILRLGGKEIHRTDVISKTLDPIWTLYTGSLCLISCTAEEFFASLGGLTFVVKDHDTMDRDDLLGRVQISAEEALAADGKRVGYEVIPDKPPEAKPSKPPMLYIRIKQANDDDVRFMKQYMVDSKPDALGMKKKKQGVHNSETFLPPRNIVEPHLKKNKIIKHEDKTRERLHRVKPCPDPNRVQETEWMRDDQVEAEAWKQSTHWIEAGSGDLGKLYVEIIGCDHLPNMDAATLSVTDKTDAFVCLAFEDCVVNTDVISNSCSPRWMPWSRRSYAFSIAHPGSKLFVGLFDYNSEFSPFQEAKRFSTNNLHDQIGRVMINLSKFVPSTVYTLTYPIYKGELAKHRVKNRGTITMRLRFEFNNMQKALAQTIQLPPTEYVSMARSIDFQLTSYTASGKHDFNAWKMTTFTGHIEELQSYEVILDYVTDAMMTVWLWRGHHSMTICGKTILVPAHSITAYIWALIISYNFNAFFSFVCFAIGWAMLAINYQVRQNPSPWHKCASYGTLWMYLLFGKAPVEVHDANYKEQEFNDYMADYKKRVQDKLDEKELEMKYDEEIIRELGDDVVLGNEEVDIATERQGGLVSKVNVFRGMNPIKMILHPIQIELGKIVIMTRTAKSIIMWRENYYAFWITTGSILMSLLVLFLPWGWILRWVFRIVLIVGLGPWMKIVDRMYFAEKPDLTEEQKKEQIRERVKKRYGAAVEKAEYAQIAKERSLKLQAMKAYMYGSHIVRVPHFNESFFSDFPMPVSHSEFYNPKKHGEVVIAERKYGQRLSGDMIPNREIQESEVKEKKVGRVGSVFKSVRAAASLKSRSSALKSASKESSHKNPISAMASSLRFKSSSKKEEASESTPLLETNGRGPSSPAADSAASSV